MGTNEDYSGPGSAENAITLGFNICDKTWGLHMEMVFHGGKPRLLEIWIREKYDYTGPQYFYPEHTAYI